MPIHYPQFFTATVLWDDLFSTTPKPVLGTNPDPKITPPSPNNDDTTITRPYEQKDGTYIDRKLIVPKEDANKYRDTIKIPKLTD